MSALIIIFILYLLLVRGYLWKGILVFFGAGALYTFILSASAQSSKTAIIIFGMPISMAAFFTAIVVILAVKTVKK